MHINIIFVYNVYTIGTLGTIYEREAYQEEKKQHTAATFSLSLSRVAKNDATPNRG